ncbi:MAG: penicillin-binding protein 2 [Anaerolineae bacterium]|jgi:penicillin-binding protein 2|nr:MAG: penicillin-binding protein 2 [Anaerolineae bacterium]
MNPNEVPQKQLSPLRITIFMIVIGAVFSVYIFRLFALQILQVKDWVARAEENRVEELNLPAPRGIIVDRNGIVLARNIPSFNVVITAANLPDDPGEVQEIYRQLSELIGVPVNLNQITPENPYVPCFSEHGIAQIAEYGLSSTPYQPVRVKCDVPEQVARIIQEKAVDWPGVSIEIEPIRDYPTGSLTASVIGFLGPIPANQEDEFRAKGLVPNRDKVGYAGLELQFQDLLAGKNGSWKVEVDVAGKVVRGLEPPVIPVPGANLRLTIDTRLQQAMTGILIGEIEFWNRYLNTIRSTSGVVIAMNPKTGEILGMVSYPTYENNRMARFIPAYYYNQLINDPANPLLNHAVGDVLPAGSVFKLTTAVGALNEGVVTPEQVLSTPPKITITERYYANDPGREREFVDWNKAGFGQLDFLGGIANSSNVYFYKLGGGYRDEVPVGLGICRLGTYARALGYGEYPGIELPDEEKGLIPDPKWKRITHGEGWSTGDTYIASVGQGYVLATPLQVLMSAATIANDGKLMKPTLIREITDAEGNVIQPFSPVMRWDITKDAVIQEFYDTTIRGCEPIEGRTKTVQPWVIDKVQEGMRRAVTNGTLAREFRNVTIAVAGKTGTAEYCDQYANAKNLCIPGNWPSHAWTVAYAPYEDPEIAVVAFVYNGGEGASVAGPIVRQVIQAYFELKRIDAELTSP